MSAKRSWRWMACLAVAWCSAAADAGAIDEQHREIVGGRAASTREYPTIAAVTFCGAGRPGAWTHPEWVLTAAHSSADGDGTCDGDSGGRTFMTIAGRRYSVGVPSAGTEDRRKCGSDLGTPLPGELDFLTANVRGLAPDDAVCKGEPPRNVDATDVASDRSVARPVPSTAFGLSGIGLVTARRTLGGADEGAR
jgi:hypothetical protein